MPDSLNNIVLSPQMLASLYGQSLVAPVDHTFVKSPVIPASQRIKVLGTNARRITILVSCNGHTFLPEAEMNFLTRMLEACRMNVGDVAIVNLANNSQPLEQLFAQLNPLIVFDFAQQLGTPFFQPQNQNGITILSAPPLKDFASQNADAKQLKSKLWAALKQVFGL